MSHEPDLKVSRTTYERVTRGAAGDGMHESCPIWNEPRTTFEGFTNHIWMKTRGAVGGGMYESCLMNDPRTTYERVTTHKWISHQWQALCPLSGTHESYPIYKWVMNHIRTSHEPQMNRSPVVGDVSPLRYAWVISNMHMSHESHTNESRTTYTSDTYQRWWVMPHPRRYGVATVSRIDTIIGLFCKTDL